MKPALCLISDPICLDVATAVANALKNVAEVVVWHSVVDDKSSLRFDELLGMIENADFGVVVSNGLEGLMLELGLLVGALGSQRCRLLTIEKGTGLSSLTVPLNLQTLSLASLVAPAHLPAAMEGPCIQIRKMIQELGCRNIHQ